MMTQVRKNKKVMTPKQAGACGGRLDELLDPELFKALCDPTRARLVSCIAKCGRACTVSEIAECCAVDLSVVSRHLQMLERAGVLASTKQGRSVSYGVEYAKVCGALRGLADAIEGCYPGDAANGGGCCGT